MNQLQAQDSLEVYYIFLEKDTTTEIPAANIPPKDTLAQVVYAPERLHYKIDEKGQKDFIRQTYLYKIPFEHSQNKVLLETKYNCNLFLDSPDNQKFKKKTLIEGIIEGVQSGKILAAAPQDLSLRYSYTQLCTDIRSFENTEYVDSVERIDMSEFGIKDTHTLKEQARTENWENLNGIMYLVAEEGSAHSRTFFRIRYLCILWYNPNRVLKPRLVMVIPYIFLEKYLKQIYLVDRKNEAKMFSVHDFLIEKMFFAEKKRL